LRDGKLERSGEARVTKQAWCFALLFCSVTAFRQEFLTAKRRRRRKKPSAGPGYFLRLLRVFAANWLGPKLDALPLRQAYGANGSCDKNHPAKDEARFGSESF